MVKMSIFGKLAVKSHIFNTVVFYSITYKIDLVKM